jgi:KDO2-lipid IV(A) lauroyltransferase
MAARPVRSWLIRLRQRAEALVVRLLYHAVRVLPIDAASALGGWLGRKLGPLVRRTRIARRNLALAFPEASPAEIESIARGMWENLGRTVFELPLLDRFRWFGQGGRIELVGAEHVGAAFADGRSGILFSAHIANWELFGPMAAAYGVPLNLVYRAPNNPHLGWLAELRRAAGTELLPKGSEGARRAMKLLQKGGRLGILVDQKMNDGIAVPFFGRDAMTAPALAQLALRFDCPALPARIERLRGARFRVTVLPPMRFQRTGDRQRDLVAAMTQVNALLEEWIRERPEQWLWLHRRWPDRG